MSSEKIKEIVKNEIKKLNDKQKEATVCKKKKVLVLAGAGTGKTRVLISRVSYLLAVGVDSNNVMAVTFTNKAANEMKERLKSVFNDLVNEKEMYIGTFHGICNRLIKENLIELNLPKNYQCMDSDDQKSFVKKIMKENVAKKNNKNVENVSDDDLDSDDLFKDKDLISFINKAKENCLRPESQGIEKLAEVFGGNAKNYLINFYKKYEQLRIVSNLLDFGDLLLYVYELLRDNLDVRKRYQEQFRHVLVDEYQDTNFIQHEIVKMISINGYLFVVGDDDQSIYGWRGAVISNILDFEKNYDPDLVHVVKLEENYRSTDSILNSANSLIAKNKHRYGKNLWTSQEGGSRIRVFEAASALAEADWIANNIEKLVHEKKYEYYQNMILYRTNYLSRSMESELFKRKIPYIIYGGTSFWARSEIKDVLSYLQLCNNKNNNIAFERIINKPKRKIGDAVISRIREYSLEKNISMFESLEQLLDIGEFTKSKKENLENFVFLLKKFSENEIYKNSLYSLVKDIIVNINLEEIYKKDDEETLQERKGNLAELLSLAESLEYEEGKTELEILLETAALQTENLNQKNVNVVKLMTIHAAKGLESENVFVMGMENDIFPSKASFAEKSLMEEERRLAYVAYTRARHNLFLSYSLNRVFGSSGVYSKFLEETPFEYIDFYSGYSYSMSSLGRRIDEYHRKLNIKTKFKIGDLVNHVIYGRGVIKNMKDNKAFLIDFKNEGLKVVDFNDQNDLSFGYKVGDTYVNDNLGNGTILDVYESSEGKVKIRVDFDFAGIHLIDL